LTKRGEAYWAEQTAIAHREAAAWLALAEGHKSAALDAMRAAAAMEGAKARGYYGQIVKLCEHGDTPGRPELQEARRAMSR
jgi:hypothetical protein